jgi:outer membrane protein assembly factor BamA
VQEHRVRRGLTALALGLVATGATVRVGAGQSGPTGLQVSALPALSYDSDLGFGAGVVAGLYQYGQGTSPPYVWAVEPVLFFTTEGQRTLSGFFDVPYVAGRGARLTISAALDRDYVPYYGLGNATSFDTTLAVRVGAPNYYTYERSRAYLTPDLQWRLAGNVVRLITGLAWYHNIAEVRDQSSRYAEDLNGGVIPAGDRSVMSWGPRIGLVLDLRDAERDPHRGVWAEALLWQGVTVLGGDHSFTRMTGVVRGYLSPVERITLAARLIGETVSGDMPVAMLPVFGSSFKDFEGVGGAQSVRGLFRNRFLGRSRVVGNVEVRGRGGRFAVLGQQFRPGIVLFADAGRVWDDRGEPELGTGLRWGKGGGLRLAWGESFIVAIDFAHGSEAGQQMYMGLGHLF